MALLLDWSEATVIDEEPRVQSQATGLDIDKWL